MAGTPEEDLLAWLEREEERLGFTSVDDALTDISKARDLFYDELGYDVTDDQFGGLQAALYTRYDELPAIGVSYMRIEQEDGSHILMWDFDDVPLEEVCQDLRVVQSRYSLSDIHICRTKEPDNYIAYCFTSQDWKTAVEIVAQTHTVDWQFLRFGVYRGHFTLRVTPKND
ncbi:unnamed protein product, partial [marine sediment metagenome]